MVYQVPMVLADEYKHIAYGPVRVLSVIGFNNNSGAGSDRYLQFHTKFPGALTAADVPTFKGLWFPSGAQSTFGRETFGEDGLYFGELLAAVSSTEINYTAVTDTGLDLTIVVDTDCLMTSSQTIAGDLTTGVNSKAIWSIASGPKKLLRLDVLVGSDAVIPFIQATNSIVTNTRVSNTSFLTPQLLSTVTKTFFFGPGGGQVVNKTTSALQAGCIIGLAAAVSSAGVVTEAGGGDNGIRAVYE